MKFSTVATAVALVCASMVAATPSTVVAAEVADVDVELSKRACTPSRCSCNGVRGQFCGTSTVNPNCVRDHVYECNPNGSTCDYGIRDSCVKCNQLSC